MSRHVRQKAQDYNETGRDMNAEHQSEGAWRHVHDIDEDVPGSEGVCDTMKAFQYNPTKNVQWERIARCPQTCSEYSVHLHWLVFAKVDRAVFLTCDCKTLTELGIDPARIDPANPHTPDQGNNYVQRTLDVGECSTIYDSKVLEQT